MTDTENEIKRLKERIAELETITDQKVERVAIDFYHTLHHKDTKLLHRYMAEGLEPEATGVTTKENVLGKWSCAPQFNRWVYAGGRKLAGLVRRREAETECWLFG